MFQVRLKIMCICLCSVKYICQMVLFAGAIHIFHIFMDFLCNILKVADERVLKPSVRVADLSVSPFSCICFDSGIFRLCCLAYIHLGSYMFLMD